MILRSKTGVHPGFTNLNNQHLKQLVDFLSESDSEEETFVEYLADITGKIANGLEPSENFFSSTGQIELLLRK
jgi:hypothetical protein